MPLLATVGEAERSDAGEVIGSVFAFARQRAPRVTSTAVHAAFEAVAPAHVHFLVQQLVPDADLLAGLELDHGDGCLSEVSGKDFAAFAGVVSVAPARDLAHFMWFRFDSVGEADWLSAVVDSNFVFQFQQRNVGNGDVLEFVVRMLHNLLDVMPFPIGARSAVVQLVHSNHQCPVFSRSLVVRLIPRLSNAMSSCDHPLGVKNGSSTHVFPGALFFKVVARPQILFACSSLQGHLPREVAHLGYMASSDAEVDWAFLNGGADSRLELLLHRDCPAHARHFQGRRVVFCWGAGVDVALILLRVGSFARFVGVSGHVGASVVAASGAIGGSGSARLGALCPFVPGGPLEEGQAGFAGSAHLRLRGLPWAVVGAEPCISAESSSRLGSVGASS